jgi:CheY-like chemotaxis protein
MTVGGAQKHWRILLVEDKEQQATTTARSLERRPVSTVGEFAAVHKVTDFDKALTQIEDCRYDLIILDIRDQATAEQESPHADAASGDEATSADKGLQVYEEIRRRRFMPIVFYSAVSHLASDLEDPPFVTVVGKLEDEGDLLRQKVTAVFDSGLPWLNRSVALHVNNVLRDFMIHFVEQHWTELRGAEQRGDLAYLMARRLARSLDSSFVAELGGGTVASTDATVHPTRLYIMPPLPEHFTGDIVRDVAGDWFMVLTPSCYLVAHSGRRKAEYVTVAFCVPLADTDEYRAWVEAGRPASNNAPSSKRLNQLIGNNRQGQQDRYYFLPPAWGMPGLLVDLQRISHISYDEFDRFTRVATLDDPYAQAIAAQFGRYAGRVGTPDLDVSAVRRRLQPVVVDAAENEASPEPSSTVPKTAAGNVGQGSADHAPAEAQE